MWLFENIPDYLAYDPWQNLSKSDFEGGGVETRKAYKYFQQRWDKRLADWIQEVQEIAWDIEVRFVHAPQHIAAFVKPDSSECIYYNLATVASWGEHAHIIEHEKWHLVHKKRWGSVDIPGFSRIPAPVLSLFALELGMASIDERAILEWLTENRATQRTRFDKNCSYNDFEVPLIKRLNDLIFDITGQSIIAMFGTMKVGDDIKFERVLLETANYLVLEKAAESMIRKQLISNQQNNIRAIARYHVSHRSWNCIGLGEAKDILLNISAELLISFRVKDSVGRITSDSSDASVVFDWLNADMESSPKILVAGSVSDRSLEILRHRIADKTSDILWWWQKHALPLGA
jgi:hypothetical protein